MGKMLAILLPLLAILLTFFRSFEAVPTNQLVSLVAAQATGLGAYVTSAGNSSGTWVAISSTPPSVYYCTSTCTNLSSAVSSIVSTAALSPAATLSSVSVVGSTAYVGFIDSALSYGRIFIFSCNTVVCVPYANITNPGYSLISIALSNSGATQIVVAGGKISASMKLFTCTFGSCVLKANYTQAGYDFPSCLAFSSSVLGTIWDGNLVYFYNCNTTACTGISGSVYMSSAPFSISASPSGLFAVGDPFAGTHGVIYIMSFNGTAYFTGATISNPAVASGGYFGFSASISSAGNVVSGIISTPSTYGIYMYNCNATSCTQFPNNPITTGGLPGTQYGTSVSLNDNIMVVGSLNSSAVNSYAEIVAYTTSNPCLYAGVYVYHSDGVWNCTCVQGLTGANCQIENESVSVVNCTIGVPPCYISGYMLISSCATGSLGNCATNCLPNPCQNGGACVAYMSSTTQHYCICAAGWYGVYCAYLYEEQRDLQVYFVGLQIYPGLSDTSTLNSRISLCSQTTSIINVRCTNSRFDAVIINGPSGLPSIQLNETVPLLVTNMNNLTGFNMGNINFRYFNIMLQSVPVIASITSVLFANDVINSPIPTLFAGSTNMNFFEMSNTGLYGTIPSFFNSFSNLQSLVLSNNYLYGPIPAPLRTRISASGPTLMFWVALFPNYLSCPIPNYSALTINDYSSWSGYCAICSNTSCPVGQLCFSVGGQATCVDDCASNYNCTGIKTCAYPAPNYLPTCTCPLYYSGSSCQISSCQNNTLCVSPSTCISTGSSNITCSCTANHNGTYCQNDFSMCLSSPCLNNGTCTPKNSSYTCNCGVNITGTNCQLVNGVGITTTPATTTTTTTVALGTTTTTAAAASATTTTVAPGTTTALAVTATTTTVAPGTTTALAVTTTTTTTTAAPGTTTTTAPAATTTVALGTTTAAATTTTTTVALGTTTTTAAAAAATTTTTTMAPGTTTTMSLPPATTTVTVTGTITSTITTAPSIATTTANVTGTTTTFSSPSTIASTTSTVTGTSISPSTTTTASSIATTTANVTGTTTISSTPSTITTTTTATMTGTSASPSTVISATATATTTIFATVSGTTTTDASIASTTIGITTTAIAPTASTSATATTTTTTTATVAPTYVTAATTTSTTTAAPTSGPTTSFLDCGSLSCKHGGVCDLGNRGAFCVCQNGYTGTTCQTEETIIEFTTRDSMIGLVVGSVLSFTFILCSCVGLWYFMGGNKMDPEASLHEFVLLGTQDDFETI